MCPFRSLKRSHEATRQASTPVVLATRLSGTADDDIGPIEKRVAGRGLVVNSGQRIRSRPLVLLDHVWGCVRTGDVAMVKPILRS